MWTHAQASQCVMRQCANICVRIMCRLVSSISDWTRDYKKILQAVDEKLNLCEADRQSVVPWLRGSMVSLGLSCTLDQRWPTARFLSTHESSFQVCVHEHLRFWLYLWLVKHSEVDVPLNLRVERMRDQIRQLYVAEFSITSEIQKPKSFTDRKHR